MPRPVPPQVIPRPPTWRPGGPAPWADVPASARTGIGLDRVLDALDAVGQRGPVPGGIGSDRVLGPAILVNESDAPAVRHVERGRPRRHVGGAGRDPAPPDAALVGPADAQGRGQLPGWPPRRRGRPVGGRAARSVRGGRPRPRPGGRWSAGSTPCSTMVSGSLIMPVLATVAARPHLVASPARGRARLRRLARRAGRPGDLPRGALAASPGASSPAPTTTPSPCGSSRSPGEMIWGATARMIHELLSIVLTGGRRGARATKARTRWTGCRAGRRRRAARRPLPPASGATTDPAMMRWPGSSVAPCAVRNDRTKDDRRGGVLDDAPLGHDRAVLRHRRDHGPRVDAGHLVAEDDAAVADVAGEDRPRCRRRAGRGPPARAPAPVRPPRRRRRRGSPPRPRRRAPLQPARSTRWPAVRHAGVDQVADDRLGQSEVLLDGGRVETDLPAHGPGTAGQLGVPAGQQGAHAAGDGAGRVLIGHAASLAPAGPAVPEGGTGRWPRRTVVHVVAESRAARPRGGPGGEAPTE